MRPDPSRLDRAPDPEAKLAVIVCTRERPEDLARCLAALRQQTEQPLDVLVVDNNPRTDRTRQAAEVAGVRYVVEPRPGLDCARNAGVAATTAPLVAFTDDDAVPEPDWAAAHVRALGEPGVAGVRPFDPAFDAGTPTESGGDTEMFGQLLDAGFTLVHEPAARVRHRHRRTRSELRRQLFGYGAGVYADWTHRWLRRRDRDVPGFAAPTLGWHIGHRLWRAILRRDGELPADLVLAEILGSLYGPVAYFRSRRRADRWRPVGAASAGATGAP